MKKPPTLPKMFVVNSVLGEEDPLAVAEKRAVDMEPPTLIDPMSVERLRGALADAMREQEKRAPSSRPPPASTPARTIGIPPASKLPVLSLPQGKPLPAKAPARKARRSVVRQTLQAASVAAVAIAASVIVVVTGEGRWASAGISTAQAGEASEIAATLGDARQSPKAAPAPKAPEAAPMGAGTSSPVVVSDPVVVVPIAPAPRANAVPRVAQSPLTPTAPAAEKRATVAPRSTDGITASALPAKTEEKAAPPSPPATKQQQPPKDSSDMAAAARLQQLANQQLDTSLGK